MDSAPPVFGIKAKPAWVGLVGRVAPCLCGARFVTDLIALPPPALYFVRDAGA